MSNESIIILKNNFTEIKTLTDGINYFAEKNHFDNETTLDISLVLDEIITNIISYGFDDDSEHKIIVHLTVNNKILSIKIEDDGIPFNPLEYPSPDTTKPLEEREVGGLGIFLVKKLMDSVEYERKENKNILTVNKSVIRNP